MRNGSCAARSLVDLLIGCVAAFTAILVMPVPADFDHGGLSLFFAAGEMAFGTWLLLSLSCICESANSAALTLPNRRSDTVRKRLTGQSVVLILALAKIMAEVLGIIGRSYVWGWGAGIFFMPGLFLGVIILLAFIVGLFSFGISAVRAGRRSGKSLGRSSGPRLLGKDPDARNSCARVGLAHRMRRFAQSPSLMLAIWIIIAIMLRFVLGANSFQEKPAKPTFSEVWAIVPVFAAFALCCAALARRGKRSAQPLLFGGDLGISFAFVILAGLDVLGVWFFGIVRPLCLGVFQAFLPSAAIAMIVLFVAAQRVVRRLILMITGAP